MKALPDARLYGIIDTGYVATDAAVDAACQLITGGVDLLQLRAKDFSPDIVADLGGRLLAVARPAGVPLIINDHPEVAAVLGCEGVHVGQDDFSVAAARAVVGPGKIVGKSTHSLAQAEAAMAEGADYIGFGPLFATPTKPGRPAIGLGDIAEAHRRVKMPVFCIGGIKLSNLAQVTAAGARRVVIVSEMLGASDRAAYVREVRDRMESVR